MATLSFRNVNKVYDNKFHAVHDFNLEVKDKEFIVFVGPSGCGKSTTLRMIAGFENITSGEIWIDDTCVNTLAPKDRNIAMVFQNYALYPHMTVYDNIAFALKLRKVYLPVMSLDEDDPNYKAEIDAKIAEYELSISKKIEQLKADKAPKDEIKAVKFRDKTDLIVELEKIASKYEKPVMTFNSEVTDALEKEIEEVKKIQPIDTAKLDELKDKLDKAYNDTSVPAFEYRHYTNNEIMAKVNETANILGLIPYLKRKPAALSGGQRQRVALGRAIVRNPLVFLMDEPLSNLDAKLRVQTRSEIIKIHRKVGATTIYVTHDQTEAMTMASRIVIMNDGVVQQIGTPKEVYDTPANMFVGGFIGSPSMNFLKGKFDGKNFLFDNGASLLLSKSECERLKNYVDKEVVLGIRPEHLHLADTKVVDKKSATFNVTVDISELLGSEVICYAFLNNEKVLLKIESKKSISTGDVLECIYDIDSVHFFESETGKAIR